MTELPPQYRPTDVEESRYQWWESQGFFRADPDATRVPYTIVIPPPNVTGILHMGHALNNTIQDICIRFKRMQGFNALWVPGTDHAGIATQNVVEKQLAKEKLKRQDLGREKFLERVWQWKDQYGNTIIRQLKRLGSSCDWTRSRFTMDEGLSEAVAEVFVRLHEKGLIYRGNYIINWCPRCQTALSDEEAPHKDTRGKLYFIKYPLVDRGSGIVDRGRITNHESRITDFIVVATTRPETMLGDTAIAVHPKDKRYKALIGKTAMLPLVNRPLEIIADEAIDPEFGTGAVKVTPAHDPVDFQLGKKHGLEFVNVMTDDGHMIDVPKAYQGLDRFECRKQVMEDLEAQGLVEKVTDHQHSVGHCYRCGTVVEPRLSLQWFVKMKPLAKPAIKAVKKGQITFTPARWTKVYLNWMENIQDWCISRQIWWGHRLPVYYCQTCVGQAAVHSPQSVVHSKKAQTTDYGLRTTDKTGVIVSKTRPESCPTCSSTDLTQDPDVLDTWFSSWLWPFSTLGWPKKTKDLEYFYPTNTLVTAPEIIFFWVARMIMAGYFCMGELPFRKVYIHGTVRDLTGKKMSKSLGNIVDPLEIIGQFGADALRYTLVTSTAVGTDVFISSEKFIVGRNFANKLWNVTRYVLSVVEGSRFKVEGAPRTSNLEPRTLSVVDRWILSRLQQTITQTTKALEEFNFNEAARLVYDFLWHDYCDWYVELVKIRGVVHSPPRPAERDCRGGQSTVHSILVQTLEASLKLLHPIMPFVTEELWQHLNSVASGEWRVASEKSGQATHHSSLITHQSIMTAPWPKADKTLINEDAEAKFALFQAIVTAIRNTRSELNVPHDRNTPVVMLLSKNEGTRRFLSEHQHWLQSLAQVSTVGVLKEEDFKKQNDAVITIVDGVEVVVPLGGLIDVAKERERIQTRVNELTGQLSRLDAQLRDTKFTERAPKEVVEQTQAKRAEVADTHKKFTNHLQLLQTL